jgi:hypothetical protein
MDEASEVSSSGRLRIGQAQTPTNLLRRSAVSEAQGMSHVEVRRAWKYTGEEDGIVHIELASGDETMNVNLKQARNPRMYEFIVGHADITTEARPPKEPKAAD